MKLLTPHEWMLAKRAANERLMDQRRRAAARAQEARGGDAATWPLSFPTGASGAAEPA